MLLLTKHVLIVIKQVDYGYNKQMNKLPKNNNVLMFEVLHSICKSHQNHFLIFLIHCSIYLSKKKY